MTIYTFEDIINKCLKNNKLERNLLLGNGFSIAYDKNVFSYEKLFEYSNFADNIKSVFKQFDTYDFEIIIKIFMDTKKLISKYKPDDSLIEELNKEADTIKEELIKSISEKHPNSQKELGQNRIFNTLIFLSKFQKIFTLNYDLLLYWVLMNKYDLENKYPNIKVVFEINDGFRGPDTLTWGYKKEEQNVYYLHGALHLYDNETEVIKIRKDDWNNLTAIIKNHLRKNKYPLIVTEGTSAKKLFKIKHNEYLNYCFEELSNIKNNLVIYGHSFADNDKHIFDKINNNEKIKNLYISVFEPENNLDDISKKVNDLFGQRLENNSLDLQFFDASSANIWSYEPIQ